MHFPERKKYWMLKLERVDPHGLNDKVGDEYKNEETHQLVDKRFPPLNIRHYSVVRGQLHENNYFSSRNDFHNKFN